MRVIQCPGLDAQPGSYEKADEMVKNCLVSAWHNAGTKGTMLADQTAADIVLYSFYWNKYKLELGLRTLSDLGIHTVVTGGLTLQTEESWKGFVGKEISYQGNDVEVISERKRMKLKIWHFAI